MAPSRRDAGRAAAPAAAPYEMISVPPPRQPLAALRQRTGVLEGVLVVQVPLLGAEESAVEPRAKERVVLLHHLRKTAFISQSAAPQRWNALPKTTAPPQAAAGTSRARLPDKIRGRHPCQKGRTKHGSAFSLRRRVRREVADGLRQTGSGQQNCAGSLSAARASALRA